MQISYDAVAEHCATEIEDPNKIGCILDEILQYLPFSEEVNQTLHGEEMINIIMKTKSAVNNMIKLDSDKYISRLKNNDSLAKECGEKIIDKYSEIIKESNIQQYLIDLFRKSASFEELGEKLSGNNPKYLGWDTLVENMRKKYNDMIMETVTPYIKKGGDNTCKV